MSLPSITKRILPELRYDVYQDAHMRLKDTIVRYKDVPCLVRGAGDFGDNQPLNVYCLNLKTMEEFVCHSSDELLDISSLPLGWCYVTREEGQVPAYLMRTTRNSQKQGVHPQSLDVFFPSQDTTSVRHGLSYRRWEELKSLAEFSSGAVVSIQSALKNRYGGPLNKDWALINPRPDRDKNFYIIYHKMIEVGTYRADRRQFFFRRDRLTKTRRVSLEDMFMLPINSGVSYGIAQQA